MVDRGPGRRSDPAPAKAGSPVSITTLLDSFAEAGTGLDDEGDRQQQVNALLLPVWDWLNRIASQANEPLSASV